MLKRITALLISAIIFTSSIQATTPTFNLKPVQLPILMYHFIVENRGDLHICPTEFERDLRFLQENGYNTVGVTDLYEFVYAGVPLPPNPVMLTFDDGYYNNYHYAFPLLQEYNAKAVIFVIGAHADIWSENFYEDTHSGHLTWEQIREMSDSGLVEFGGHTYDMHKLRGRKGVARWEGENLWEFQRVFGRDTQKFNDRFAEELGYTPTAFAFPFHEVCDDAANVLQILGYRALFTYRAKNTRNELIAGEPDCLLNLYRMNRSRLRSAQDILSAE
ncbi:MAG: polysaccharide deacetylase family protein [Oscillospiraceae bacterium]|nr:polysaccharide deacetylase family protein [Oscillospiraceae bacterium]